MILEIASSFTPQVIFAMIGGLTGAAFGIAKNQHNARIAFLLLVIGAMAASGAADYLVNSHGVTSVYVIGIVSMPIGLVSGFLMDALEVASPRLAAKLVNKLGDKTIDKIDKF